MIDDWIHPLALYLYLIESIHLRQCNLHLIVLLIPEGILINLQELPDLRLNPIHQQILHNPQCTLICLVFQGLNKESVYIMHLREGFRYLKR